MSNIGPVMNLRIAGIVEESIVDGPGIRYTIFTQGCHHLCLGCHNPQTHDINAGSIKEVESIVEDMKRYPLLSGITLSGGEPFLQIDACLELLEQLDQDHLDVMVYTGYTFENLVSKSKTNQRLRNLLNRIDYLIDGKFQLEMKDLSLSFRGSMNQRIINVKKSLEVERIVDASFES